MSIHIQVTHDNDICLYRRHQGFWMMTDPTGWEHTVTVESTINLLDAVSTIGFGHPDPDQLTLDELDTEEPTL